MTKKIVDEIWNLIQEASSVVYQVAHKTPLEYSTTFSRMTGNEVYLKLENLQKTGSFKVRGAFFKIYKNLEEARKRGVIAASSGNHAQGVAYASHVLGVNATIVMPETAPPSKIHATRSYGARVILYGSVYNEAYKKAMELVEKEGLMFIHPFNDKEIIAGQGTLGLEIVQQIKDVDAVIVPIGGGGLISGVGIAVKKINPKTKVIGVEPKAAPKYYEARKSGRIVEVSVEPSIADGVITKRVEDLTFNIMNEIVDDVVTVREESIANAIALLMERAKVVVEGAGALPLAAMLEGYLNGENKRVVLLLSGGNIDLTTLYRVIIRGLRDQKRIGVIRVLMRDVPGGLYRILEILYKNKCSIIDIKHDRFSVQVPVGYALVDIIFEAPEEENIRKVYEEIKNLGMRIELL